MHLQLSLPHQLLALFDELRLLLLGGRLCKQESQRTENGEPCRSNRYRWSLSWGDYKSLSADRVTTASQL